MSKEICPITGKPMECQSCKEIKDTETCILWEPEAFAWEWGLKLAKKMREKITKELEDGRKVNQWN